MKKFLVLYYSPPEAMEKMKNATDEEKAEGMKPWAAWMEKVGDKLVDGGAPLGQGMSKMTAGTNDCSGKVSGYSVLSADDMDGAMSLVEDHPHLAWMPDCSLEVYEMMPM